MLNVAGPSASDPSPSQILIGNYLSLAAFCTCTQTYQKYADKIDPYPSNREGTIPALQALGQHVLDPVIAHFGSSRFQMTYGFCSIDLKRYLSQKDPVTGMKHGRVDPSRDQHMAHEVNRLGKYYCDRLGAACDFRVVALASDCLVAWILEQRLPFDSLYYYGRDRPIHISYGPQHKRAIWAFSEQGMPTQKGIEQWVEWAKPTEITPAGGVAFVWRESPIAPDKRDRDPHLSATPRDVLATRRSGL
jgi:hypothetical protein